MIQHLDNTNFQNTIDNNGVVLVDFYADWCGPCQTLHPTLEQLASDYDGKAVISKINIDSNPELAAKFKVRSIPALFYFKDGELAEKQNGLQSIQVLQQNLNGLLN